MAVVADAAQQLHQMTYSVMLLFAVEIESTTLCSGEWRPSVELQQLLERTPLKIPSYVTHVFVK